MQLQSCSGVFWRFIFSQSPCCPASPKAVSRFLLQFPPENRWKHFWPLWIHPDVRLRHLVILSTEAWRAVLGLHLLSVLSRFRSPGWACWVHARLSCWLHSVLSPRIQLLIWQSTWETAAAWQNLCNTLFYSAFIFADEMDLQHKGYWTVLSKWFLKNNKSY